MKDSLNMVKLYILGSGSGIPTQQRFNTSMVVKVIGATYLFDTGEPCSSLLIRNKIDYGDIRCVFISHMHADHFSGIFQLIQTLQLSPTSRYHLRGKTISLFIPKEAVNIVRKIFPALYLMPETLPFSLKVLPIQESYFYEDNHLRIKAINNGHLRSGYKKVLQNSQNKYHNAFQSYSFSIEIKRKKLLYSGDISDIGELDEFLDKTDLLILELAHIDSEKTLRFLSKKDVHKIVFTHLHPNFDDVNKDELGQLQRQIQKYVPGRAIIAYDGLAIKI